MFQIPSGQPSALFFQREKDFYHIYLVMALSLDRREFLEYLGELGVHLWNSLTVKSLWSLYYKVKAIIFLDIPVLLSFLHQA